MPKPNILLIIADDLGVDALRIANGKVTARIDGPNSAKSAKPLPNLGRLLKSGVHFSHAWANPVCTPTRGSLFTGLAAWKHTVGFPEPGGNGELPAKDATNADIKLLPQRMRTHGYHCGLFGKWDLGRERGPIDWGWDHFEGMYEGGLRNVQFDYYGQTPGVFGPVTLKVMRGITDTATKAKRDAAIESCKTYLQEVCGSPFVEGQPDVRYYMWEKTIEKKDGTKRKELPHERKHLYATIDQVQSARAWIAKQDDQPWCVALALTVPHDPYHVPPKESYEIEFAKPGEPTVQEMFIAMIESMDFYIGKLLDAPAIRKQLENTVIVFVGDNGTQDRDLDNNVQLDNDLQDKASPFIGGVHVPMIVADGGVLHGGSPCYLKDAEGKSTAGTSTSNIVHIMDLYNTALDVAGAEPVKALDSISMEPHLKKRKGPRRSYVFSQQYPLPTAPRAVVGKHASVSDGKYKLSCVRRAEPATGAEAFDYVLSVLEPSTKIPGALAEKALDLTDPAYFGKARELYLELRQHRLDSGANSTGKPLKFPTLPQPTLSKTPSLDQLVASPVDSANFAPAASAIPNIEITGAPSDAGLGRWAMLHDGSYYFTCMRKEHHDAILVFGFKDSDSSYTYGHGSLGDLKVAGFPADTDTGRYGLVHDGTSMHLFMRRRGAKPALYRALLTDGTFKYGGQDGLPNTIAVASPGPDIDWSRWSMSHDGTGMILWAMMVGDNTRIQRFSYDAQNKRFKPGQVGTISGAPDDCDYHSVSVLHDDTKHRLYFQTR